VRSGRVLYALLGSMMFFLPASVYASTIVDTKTVSFSSDLQPAKNITLSSFDTLGGTRTLTGVTVELFHSGSADMGIDNDDLIKTADVNGRIVRTWSLTGPGIVGAGASKTVKTAVVHLAVDNGDGAAIVDMTGPDGTDFGTVSYSNLAAGTFNPATALYATNGPGTVDFTVTPDFMSNDFQFTGTAPNNYYLAIENTNLTVAAKVTYTYTPEPATMALLAAGSLGTVILRRHRR